jgi:predicted permease
VTPRYFETFGIPILLGRDFRMEDSPAVSSDPPERYQPNAEGEKGGPPRVAIVNESFARKYFAGRGAVGMHLAEGDKYDPAKGYEIVGVVRDARYFGMREEIEPMVYIPAWRQGAGRTVLCVRSGGDMAALVEGIRRKVQEQDPSIAIQRTRTMEEYVDQNIVQERLVATLSSFFGALALLLASVGLYGVTAQAVARRTREIGIRMAMGAQRSAVLGMILRDAMLLVAIGAAIGVPAALALSRYVESLLFGVKPQDPLTIGLAVVVLGAISLAASLAPARRASSVDPMQALRYE